MKLKILLVVIMTVFMILQPKSTSGQSVNAGDVVYFKVSKVGNSHYFTTPVYIIATVKKVIGSNAILSTDVYLYKCKRSDSYWELNGKLSIAKRNGLGYYYETWRAEDNTNYTRPTKILKKYTNSVEMSLTSGKIKSIPKNCSVIADN